MSDDFEAFWNADTFGLGFLGTKEESWEVWQAAKADELAFLQRLSAEAHRYGGDPRPLIRNRIDVLNGGE